MIYPSVRGAGVQHGAHLYDHLRRDDPFQPEQQPPDPGTGRRQGDPAQHRTHRHRPAGVRDVPQPVAALLLGCPLRAGRRQCGCCAQQLCSAALCQPPYELAALYVGRGHHHRTLADQRSPDRRSWLERRLSADRSGAGADRGGPAAQPAPLGTSDFRQWLGDRDRRPFPAGGAGDPRCKRSDALLFWLLRLGEHRWSVGRQLSDLSPGYPRRDGRRFCGAVLSGHHRRAGGQRMDRPASGRRRHDPSGALGHWPGSGSPAAAGACGGLSCRAGDHRTGGAHRSTPASSIPPRRTLGRTVPRR